MRLIFLDLETTGLEAGRDQITEAAWICDDGVERQYFVEHDRLPCQWVLDRTDYATRILYAQKFPLDHVLTMLRHDCARLGAREENDGVEQRVHLVGACPAFDDRFLRDAFGDANVPYHYHVIDVEAMALGSLALGDMPSLSKLRGLLGIEGENPAPHSALADAREAMLIYRAIRARAARLEAAQRVG